MRKNFPFLPPPLSSGWRRNQGNCLYPESNHWPNWPVLSIQTGSGFPGFASYLSMDEGHHWIEQGTFCTPSMWSVTELYSPYLNTLENLPKILFRLCQLFLPEPRAVLSFHCRNDPPGEPIACKIQCCAVPNRGKADSPALLVHFSKAKEHVCKNKIKPYAWATHEADSLRYVPFGPLPAWK